MSPVQIGSFAGSIPAIAHRKPKEENMKKTTVTPTPTWKTSDYFIASFLMAKGTKVLGIDGTETTRKIFILHDPDPDNREKEIMNFKLATNDIVSATKLFEAQRTLQRLLRDS